MPNGTGKLKEQHYKERHLKKEITTNRKIKYEWEEKNDKDTDMECRLCSVVLNTDNRYLHHEKHHKSHVFFDIF